MEGKILYANTLGFLPSIIFVCGIRTTLLSIEFIPSQAKGFLLPILEGRKGTRWSTAQQAIKV